MMKTIIVIEDNKMNMKLALTLLAMEGYQVFGAEDAETGLNLIRQHKPNLILMDVQLPGIDGLEATRRLKVDTELAHIPVLALTGLAMDGDRDKVLASGCNDYLTKPLDYKKLFAMLKKMISESEGNNVNK